MSDLPSPSPGKLAATTATERENWHTRRRQQTRSEADQDLTFAPKLNRISRKLAANLNAEQLEARRELHHQRVVAAAQAHMRFQPTINPTSASLVTSDFHERQRAHAERCRERLSLPALSTDSAKAGANKLRGKHSTRRDHGTRIALKAASPPNRRTKAPDPPCACINSSCQHPSHGTLIRHRPAPKAPGRRGPLEASRAARERALEAVRAGKVYTMYGRYEGMREALERRGWVAKPVPIEGDNLSDYDLSGVRARPAPASQPALPGKNTPDPFIGSSQRSTPEASHVQRPQNALVDEDRTEDEKFGDSLAGETDSDAQDSDDDGSNHNTDHDDDDNRDEHDRPEDMEARVQRALQGYPANLIFTCHMKDLNFRTMKPFQMVNHFDGHRILTTKAGLTRLLEDTHWTSSEPASTFYPHCFSLVDKDGLAGFVQHFRLLCATTLLRKRMDWDVPHQALSLSYRAVNAYVHDRTAGEAEVTFDSALTAVEWEAVLRLHYSLLDCLDATPAQPLAEESELQSDSDADGEEEGPSPAPAPAESVAARRLITHGPTAPGRSELEEAIVPFCSAELRRQADQLRASWTPAGKQIAAMDAQAAQLLATVHELWPQLATYGHRNVWVVKPAALSRGRGIFCENRLDFILQTIVAGSSQETWVAQKYVEDTLLINDTKFDIRQWVVVTSWNPLVAYIYRDSYLRFSSVPFNLDNIHSKESSDTHLCNNSIQKSATIRPTDEWAPECMWSSNQYRAHLEEQGQGTAWAERIFPAMCQVTRSVLLAAQPQMHARKNSFELFGLDFMFDAQHSAWLLEVNASPDLSHSTAVTADLVPRALEDLAKLVLDRRDNRKADIGNFELIIKEPAVPQPLNAARDLALEGKGLRRPQALDSSRLADLAQPSTVAAPLHTAKEHDLGPNRHRRGRPHERASELQRKPKSSRSARHESQRANKYNEEGKEGVLVPPSLLHTNSSGVTIPLVRRRQRSAQPVKHLALLWAKASTENPPDVLHTKAPPQKIKTRVTDSLDRVPLPPKTYDLTLNATS